MKTREEKIAFIQQQMGAGRSQGPARDQKIAFIQQKMAQAPAAPTEGESMARGAAQGATLGFADEIAGGVEALWNKAKGDPTEFGKLYQKHRDESRANFRAAQEANPVSYGAGELGGAVATAFVPGLNVAKGATLAAKVGRAAATGMAAGGLGGAGYSEADSATGVIKDAATGAAIGGTVGAAAPVAAQAIQRGARSMGKFAEKAAVNATGATGKQASEFADDAGRQLLDRKIVRFGDSQERIAARASEAVDAANKQIDDALTKLEASGVKVDANDIYRTTRQTINKMKSDPSKADVARLLEAELDNLINATEAKGSTSFGVREAEQIKRGYNRKAGNWADPEKSMAGKEMYQTWRRGVEGAAEAADPATAKLFEEGKKTYGLLRPIEEAAERRASTTAQSPPVGFLDVSSGAAGAVAGGPVGAILAPVARRLIAPRMSSSVAVAADKAAKAIGGTARATEAAARKPGLIQYATPRPVRPASGVRAVGDGEDQPTKGPERWARVGAERLQEHGVPPAEVEALRETKKGRDLLNRASDLKPGSKAMEDVVKRMRTAAGRGGDQ